MGGAAVGTGCARRGGGSPGRSDAEKTVRSEKALAASTRRRDMDAFVLLGVRSGVMRSARAVALSASGALARRSRGSLKCNMSLPNLSALDPARRSAPTAEFYKISTDEAKEYWKDKVADDKCEYDNEEIEKRVRKIPDPITLEPLPFSDSRHTFRVQKVPNDPDRGYNWYDARALAESVKNQIKKRKHPRDRPTERNIVQARHRRAAP